MPRKEPIKLVRSRRPGGGRPYKYGEPTRLLTVRVPYSIPVNFVEKILDLRECLDHWEAEIEAHPPSRTANARYWHVKRAIEDIRRLGF